VLLPVDFDEYRRYSRLFKAAVRSVAPCVEDRGIDEIYIDLTDLPGAQDDGGARWRRRSSDAVREATGLSCSIGITPNKLLSKICSDLDKPDGLTCSATRHPGAHLAAAGQEDQRHRPEGHREAGRPSASARSASSPRPTPTSSCASSARATAPGCTRRRTAATTGPWSPTASPSRSAARPPFERDLHAVRDRATLSAIFTELCVELAGDLTRKGYAGKTIGIKLRFDDFRIVTRDLTLPAHTMDARTIRRAAANA
jgi:DNA polymerase-4